MTLAKLEIADLPADLGAPKPLLLPATRYRQGGRTMYHVTTPVSELPRFIVRKPDPNEPMAGNRRVDSLRARRFGEYLVERTDWVSPALIVNAPIGEVDFDPKMDFENGTSWGVMEIPVGVLHGIAICDGQHRTLGVFEALEKIEGDIRAKRERIEEARAQETADLVPELEKGLQRLIDARDRLHNDHIAIDVAEVNSEQGQQMFVDIADNAKGINKDLTTVLDQREAVNRIALELIENHPLLIDRIETGQAGRWSSKNPNLMGAKNVGDIVRALNVGVTGRVGKRVDDELSRNFTEATEEAGRFLDTLVASFPDLRLIQEGELEPLAMRSRSLLGSATMIRVLAGVFYELQRPKEDTGFKPMTRAQVGKFFAEVVEPHLEEIPMDENNQFWMPSKAFLPGKNAPQGMQGALAGLVRHLAGKARS